MLKRKKNVMYVKIMGKRKYLIFQVSFHSFCVPQVQVLIKGNVKKSERWNRQLTVLGSKRSRFVLIPSDLILHYAPTPNRVSQSMGIMRIEGETTIEKDGYAVYLT